MMDNPLNIVLDSAENLPVFQPRRFVPLTANLRSKDAVAALFAILRDREIADSGSLEKWVLDRSELEAALDQERSVLYIRMTCQTDHQEYSVAYQDFVEEVQPVMHNGDDQLNRRYLDLAKRYPLDAKRYFVYDRGIRADIELFREENVGLQTQLQLLAQEYQAVCGAWTVHFEGKEQTLTELGKFLNEPDSALREQVWRLIVERRMKDALKLDGIFDKMLSLRQSLAQNAGCKDFIEYQFRAYHRFDYTSKECKEYHRAIQDLLVPVWKEILDQRCQKMKKQKLRPWDLDVDPLGRPALKPFSQTAQLVSGVSRIFHELQPELGKQFDQMARQGLLDLENRKGKAPGGYQNNLNEARLPFIFMNAVGVDDDVRTLLHEGGHAFHAFACGHDPLLAYRHGPMEFCEVASMSMELLGGDHLEDFYSADDKERSRVAHLEGVIYILIWVAIVDAFQHWIYEHPQHSALERRQAWVNIHRQFGGDFIDWTGLEKYQEILWHRQLHIFEVPFYYIEYGIAQLGALQIWLNARKDKADAFRKYRAALALGGSKPLPELFKAAGIKFDFSKETIAPLVEVIGQELKI